MNDMPIFQEQDEYIKLLETLIKVVDANKGTALGRDNRLLEVEGLCKKFIGHVSSALYLFGSTTLPSVKVTDRGISFFDPGSINVLGRAALESFLVFHYIFIEPQTDDEKDFRYYSWLYASLLDRQKFPSRSEEGKKQLTDEKQIINAVRETINNNSVFKQLDEKKKKRLFEGHWRHQSWTSICMSAGLSEILSKQFYGHLCAYAHSGCQSVQQIGNAVTAGTQKAMCVATMKLVMIAMANMIKINCQMFTKSKDVIQQDDVAKKLIDHWVHIGTFLQNEF